jgi:hypothetical protein
MKIHSLIPLLLFIGLSIFACQQSSQTTNSNELEKKETDNSVMPSDQKESKSEQCSSCDGSGIIICKMCDGTGMLRSMPGIECGCTAYNKNMILMGKEPSIYSGPRHPCSDCKGTGLK